MTTPQQIVLAHTLIREAHELISSAYALMDCTLPEDHIHHQMSSSLARMEQTTHALRTAGIQQENEHDDQN